MEFSQSSLKNESSTDVVNTNTISLCGPTPVFLVDLGKSGLNLLPQNNTIDQYNNQFMIDQQQTQIINDNSSNKQPQQMLQLSNLTQSQLQSLSYIIQTQNNAAQFIQTSNGLMQIIPQYIQPTNNDPSNNRSMNTPISLNYNLQPINYSNQMSTIDFNGGSMSQLIPVQQLVQNTNTDPNSMNGAYDPNCNGNMPVSSIIDLNQLQSANQLNGIGIDNSSSVGVTSTNNNTVSTTTGPGTGKKKPRKKKVDRLKQEALVTMVADSIKQEEGASNFDESQVNASSSAFDNKGRAFAFFCSECPKKFTLNSRLTAHMRCHTGLRPFSCDICGFSFTQKSYLIRHAAVHKEERPFHCEKCQKNYKHYGSLANHRKLHKKQDDMHCASSNMIGGNGGMIEGLSGSSGGAVLSNHLSSDNDSSGALTNQQIQLHFSDSIISSSANNINSDSILC